MRRTLSLMLSFLTVAILFSATAAQAGVMYRATLAEAPAERVLVIRSAPWVCNEDSCSTDRARSAPANVCHSVARELGVLTAFTADDEAFTAEELARCNEAAG